jgi:hypothetical protein
MKTNSSFLLLVLSLTSAASGGVLDDIVSRHYPAILSQLAAKHHLRDERQQARVETTIGGKSYIVAAYSNGSAAAIELLEPAGNDAIVRQLIRDHQLGYDPDLSLVDLDNDGISEVVLNLASGPRGGSETWIYQFRDGQLARMNPVDKYGNTELGYPDILDFGGTGKMDLVDQFNTGPRTEPTVHYQHYVLQNGAYIERGPLDYYGLFFRAKGAPATQTETLSIPATALGKPFRLTIFNGADFGPDVRVTAGTITLNGVTVAAPSDFRQARASWTLPVTLQTENTITIRLEGAPGGRIAIAIRHE